LKEPIHLTGGEGTQSRKTGYKKKKKNKKSGVIYQHPTKYEWQTVGQNQGGDPIRVGEGKRPTMEKMRLGECTERQKKSNTHEQGQPEEVRTESE